MKTRRRRVKQRLSRSGHIRRMFQTAPARLNTPDLATVFPVAVVRRSRFADRENEPCPESFSAADVKRETDPRLATLWDLPNLVVRRYSRFCRESD